MALDNKLDIETELQHALMLSDTSEVVLDKMLSAADSADKDELKKIQKILEMIVDAEYTEPDLL